MCWVFPGFDDVLAKSLCSHNMLMSELFPTLLRPMKANSGKSPTGNKSFEGYEPLNSAFIF